MALMGDYYGCMPALSNSISSAFANNSEVAEAITEDPCAVLQSAYKLRSPALFREALIHCLGPWSQPRFKTLSEPAVLEAAERAHLRLSQKINQVYYDIFMLAANRHHGMKVYVGEGRDTVVNMLSYAEQCLDSRISGAKLCLPFYLRTCNGRPNSQYVCQILGPLLRNDLKLDGGAVAGQDAFQDFFLCAEDEIPWDMDETDW